LRETIERERGNLAKADSLLGCLVIAMEYDAESVDRPYYPDVAAIARELVKQSVRHLDPVMLEQSSLRNKVKDETRLLVFGRIRISHDVTPSPTRDIAHLAGGPIRRARTFRLHRRNYRLRTG